MKDSTRVVADEVFRACRLTEVSLPNGLVNIGGGYAFAYCNNLESITIPDTVTEMGSGVFEACRNLKKLYCPMRLQLFRVTLSKIVKTWRVYICPTV